MIRPTGPETISVGPEQHRCACPECDPELAPTGERKGEHHAATRFDVADQLCIVSKDGKVIEDCVEVEAGREGRAWRLSRPTHRCRTCQGGSCMYIDHGHFSVRRAPLLS